MKELYGPLVGEALLYTICGKGKTRRTQLVASNLWISGASCLCIGGQHNRCLLFFVPVCFTD